MDREGPNKQRETEADHIREVILKKDWYVRDESGAFLFEQSIDALAEKLSLDRETVITALEASFTPDSVATVMVSQDDGSQKEVPLPQALKDLGIELILWTEGDPAWQEKKLKLTGLDTEFPTDHRHIIHTSKTDHLPNMYESIRKTNPDARITIIDDKQKNVDAAQNHGNAYRETQGGVAIDARKISFTDPEHNAQTLYEYLKNMPNEPHVVICDMDDALIDTTRAIGERLPQNLTSESI